MASPWLALPHRNYEWRHNRVRHDAIDALENLEDGNGTRVLLRNGSHILTSLSQAEILILIDKADGTDREAGK